MRVSVVYPSHGCEFDSVAYEGIFRLGSLHQGAYLLNHRNKSAIKTKFYDESRKVKSEFNLDKFFPGHEGDSLCSMYFMTRYDPSKRYFATEWCTEG